MSYWYFFAPIAVIGFFVVRALSRSAPANRKQDSGDGWDPGYTGYGDSSGFAAADAQADEACGGGDSDSGSDSGGDAGGDCGGGDGGGGGD